MARRNTYGMDDYESSSRHRDNDKQKGDRKNDDDKPHKKKSGDDGPHKDVDYDIDIHAKLKGQAQLQGQGQGQGQHQSQSQKNYNSNKNKNHNESESKSKAESKVDVEIDGLQPEKDNDHIDIDVKDHAKIDNLLVSEKGDVDYNPGDDVSFEDILNDALNGKGNDTGIVFSQNGVINDQDYLKNPSVTNKGDGFEISGDAKGGDAYAQEGIDAGGNGGEGASSYAKKGMKKSHHDKKLKLDGGDGGDGGNGGTWGSNNKDDGFVEGISHANADGIIATEAFNQTIVQGANVLHNQVDMNVVGGNYHETLTGEDVV